MADHVLVGVDDTESALDAVRWGAREAARRGVSLRLVHAYPTPGDFPDLELTRVDVRAETRRLGAELLDRAASAAAGTDRYVFVETELRPGDSRVVLLDESRHASLAALGSRQLGAAGGLLVGSLGLALAVYGRCPLIVVRGADTERGPVLVGADGSPSASVALEFAFVEAMLAGAPLTVLRTWSGAPADAIAEHERQRRALENRLSPWRERFPAVPVDPVVARGRPGPVLLEYGRHARLIVVGSRGDGGGPGWLLGATGQRAARHSPRTVAIVRAALSVPTVPGSRASLKHP